MGTWGRNRRRAKKTYGGLSMLICERLNLFISRYRHKLRSNPKGFDYHNGKLLLNRDEYVMLVALTDRLGRSGWVNHKGDYPSLIDWFRYQLKTQYDAEFSHYSVDQMAAQLLLPPADLGDSYDWELDSRVEVQALMREYKQRKIEEKYRYDPSRNTYLNPRPQPRVRFEDED